MAFKTTETIRNTIKSQMLVWEFESFFFERMHGKKFWADDEAEVRAKDYRDSIFGRETHQRFEDCDLKELKGYADYLCDTSGIEYAEFGENSMWDEATVEMFSKVKGALPKNGLKMTAKEKAEREAAVKPKAPKTPAKKKAPAKSKAKAKKAPAKKKATPKAKAKTAKMKKAA